MKKKIILAIAIVVAIRDVSAERDDGKPVNKASISKRIGIGADYVEQLIVPIRDAGFVHSRRGINGGFVIADIPILASDIAGLYKNPSWDCESLPDPCMKIYEGVNDAVLKHLSGIVLNPDPA